ncbi:MAG: carboxypeptidase-like regulatory domain-containing protein [Gemmatimonas sp.]
MRFESCRALVVSAVLVAGSVVALTPAAGHSQIAGTQPVIQPATLRRESITGIARSTTGAPLGNVVVIATMAPERRTFSDTTDAAGRFTLNIAQGTGDYLLYIAAPGFTAFRKRLVRTGTDSAFVVDAALAPAVTQLATVKVAAKKATPQRLSGAGPVEAGAAEKLPEALVGVISPDAAGDLNALATTVPGLNATAGGYSTLGLAPSQNSITLSGAQFSGTSLPRDVRTTTRVSTSTYDPARGWFSGSNVNVELVGGGLFGSSRGHLTVDAPVLQGTDRLSRSAGQAFSNVRLSYGADAPINWQNRHFYNAGVQVDRRSSNLPSLLSVSPEMLASIGVAGDSTAALLQVLEGTNIPVAYGATPAARVSNKVSLLGRFEKNPTDVRTFTPFRTTYGITAIAQHSSDKATGMGALSTPSRVGNYTQRGATLQGTFSRFFSKDYLNDTRSTVSWNDWSERSLLRQPEGQVLVQSQSPDNEDGLSTLLFGGNSAGNRSSTQFTWETINTTRFYASGREDHGVKITADVRYDGYRSRVESNPYGTFTFASLDDLRAGQPTSYSRSLNAPTRSGGAWNGFVAIGDNWRPNRTFQMMYGARIEGNAFTGAPAHNAEVARAFGVRTDHAPSTVHVSPRVGFTWIRAAGPSLLIPGPSGQYTTTQPRYIRGGIGEFRNMISPSLLAEPMVATGLPNGLARISCIGNATPAPDWAAYASSSTSIPSQCAGNAAPAFADGAPNVRLVSDNYRAPTSWRANLVYGSRALRMDWSVEGIYSLNLNQPGSVNLNFSGSKQFALGDDGRAVFVPTSAVVPTSGMISAAGSRLDNGYGRVMAMQSDLRSVSRQVTLNVRPVIDYMNNWYWSGSYTLASNRSQTRGFDGVTADSPFEKQWGRGDFDVRHQIQSQFGYQNRGVSIAGFARLQSGLPFTPVVAGDINGDGLSNDRAYISNATQSPALAASMNQLLASSTGNVRRCIQAQMGTVAARNSCSAPWSMTMNAQVTFTQRALTKRRISSIAINITNPLAAIDRMVNGSEGLRGWGSVNVPDAQLLSVRGFDPASRTFMYNVNQRFGKAQQNSVLARTPFRLTLDVSMDLGTPVARQQLNQWLRPGRAGKPGPKLTHADLKRRYERNVPDPFAMVLQNSDSLLVNRAQVEALQASQRVYRARLDTIWNNLASELAALGDAFDDAAVLKRQEASLDEAWEVTRQAVHRDVAPVLHRVQLSLLPGWVAALYKADKPMHYRRYMPGG